MGRCASCPPTSASATRAGTGPRTASRWSGMKRLENVQACIEDVLAQDVPGDLIETGVWRGGTSIFMRAVLKAHGDRRPARVRGGLLRGAAASGRRAVPGGCEHEAARAGVPLGLAGDGAGPLPPPRAAGRPGAVREGLVPRHDADPDRRAVVGDPAGRRPVRVHDHRAGEPLSQSVAGRLRDRRRLQLALVLPQGGDRLPRGARHHRRDPRDRLDRRLLAQGRRRAKRGPLHARRDGPRVSRRLAACS